MKITPARCIAGTISIPGDKSISHRAVMLGSLAEGETQIKNFLTAEDCLYTLKAFQALGVDAALSGTDISIKGRGLSSLKAPKKEIYLGNSGTGMRLISGILSAQGFESTLTGDESLSKRPMDRIIIPLKLMGAAIDARNNKFPPLKIKGGNLKPITYKSPVASAQVKSAVLLAGLFTKGRTTVIEPAKSRDHTEKMLKLLGADIKVNGLKVSLSGPATLKGSQIEIPGDPSSAAFFVVAASLLKGSDINIVNVLHNPTRIAFIETLKKMNASLAIKNIRTVSGEEVCDIAVKSSTLKGVNIEKGSIPKLIDELPVLMVAASFAKGRTSIKGAGELRVKETDRINSITANLKKMGADIEVIESNITIEGKASLKGADFKSFGDHRTAMSMATAGLAAAGESTIDDTDCINTSFPGFLEMLDKVRNFDRVG